MTKKIILSFLSILIIFVGATIYTEENLSKHTVYYAQHLPHGKERHPVPVLIMENLEIIKNPNINNYTYDFDGMPIIYNDNYSLGLFSDGLTFVNYSKLTKEYKFTKNEKLDSAFINNDSNTDSYSINLESVNQSNIWKEVDKFLKPFVDSQPKPKINLQWLFNMRYGKRFK